jgi:NTE family protein
VLERAGLSADVVAGTSAGSLVGALYASGMPVAQIRQAALSLDEGTLGDWTLSLRGLLRGKALQDIVNRLVAGRSIEDFPRRFAATAVDLYNGQLVLFRQGEAGLAVRASSAVPGVFEAVRVAGREYIDGGVASPVPVRTARTLGAEVVVAVDIAAQPRFQATDNMARVLSQTFTIMSQHLGRDELRAADVVITPAIGDLGSVEFGQRNLAIAEGERAAEAALPAIRAALAVLRPANT